MHIVLSKHAKVERENRLTYIAMTIGFGQVIKERIAGNHRICLTNTGVILIKDIVEEFLVTAYIGDQAQVSWMYPNERVPQDIWYQMKRNATHIKKQNLIIFQKKILTITLKYDII